MDVKVTCTIFDEEQISFELGYDEVAYIISAFDDSDENITKLAVLANHSCSAVREAVAYRDNISEDTVKRLASDPVVSVLQALLSSRKAREILSTEQLLEMILKDVSLAEFIASNIEHFDNASSDKISQALALHPDAKVRSAVACNYCAPKKLIKKLLDDTDPKVCRDAKLRISR